MISPVFFLCLRVQVDEEEEVKKKRGNADQYVSVVFGDSQHTRSHRCAASSTATSRVDPKSDHCLVSPVILCYAFTEYTTSQTLVSSVVQCTLNVILIKSIKIKRRQMHISSMFLSILKGNISYDKVNT